MIIKCSTKYFMRSSCMAVRLSVCTRQFVCLFVRLSVRLSIHLSVRKSVYMSVHPSVCQFSL